MPSTRKSSRNPVAVRMKAPQKVGNPYDALAIRARTTGKILAEYARNNVASDKNALSNTIARLGHQETKAYNLIEQCILNKSVTGFNGQYRRIHNGTDEIIGTSLVRSAIEGAIEYHKKNNLSSTEVRYLSYVLAQWSEFRNPTSIVGYRTAQGFAQHPSPVKTALISRDANPKKRGFSEHRRLDIKRQDVILSKMERHILKSRTRPQYTDIRLIVLKAAIKGVRFHYNALHSPPPASNVILDPGVTKAEMNWAHTIREQNKSRVVV